MSPPAAFRNLGRTIREIPTRVFVSGVTNTTGYASHCSKRIWRCADVFFAVNLGVGPAAPASPAVVGRAGCRGPIDHAMAGPAARGRGCRTSSHRRRPPVANPAQRRRIPPSSGGRTPAILRTGLQLQGLTEHKSCGCRPIGTARRTMRGCRCSCLSPEQVRACLVLPRKDCFCRVSPWRRVT